MMREGLQDGTETCYDVCLETVTVTIRQEAELKMLRL